jgi:hypothetical protein
VLELIDEHRIRAEGEETRIRSRSCSRLRLVQVEHRPVELPAEPGEQRALAHGARSGKDYDRLFGYALRDDFEETAGAQSADPIHARQTATHGSSGRLCGKIYRLFLGRLTEHIWENLHTLAGKLFVAVTRMTSILEFTAAAAPGGPPVTRASSPRPDRGVVSGLDATRTGESPDAKAGVNPILTRGRGSGDGSSVGAGSASAVARVSFPARCWFSVRAVSRSASARSARMRRASRVSSSAVMRAWSAWSRAALISRSAPWRRAT